LVKLLHTQGVSAELRDLIDSSQEFLILVSPYLRIPQIMRDRIKSRDSRGIKTILVYRKDTDPSPEELGFLKELQNVSVEACEHLHVKCYMNERSAIITSMNLTEYSQMKNWEIGIKIEKDKEPALYTDTFNEINKIIEACVKKIGKDFELQEGTIRETAHPSQDNGYCIRCRKPIEMNKDRPLCSDCYGVWSIYGNTNYQEKYCHSCGKEYPTTYEKPLCPDCFNRIFHSIA